MIRAILFDLDDTLFAHSRAVAMGLTEHLRLLGCANSPEAAYSRWRELEELHYNSYLRGEVGFQEQRRLRARNFIEDLGISLSSDHEADTWFCGFLREYKRAWALYEDVLPTFESLRMAIPDLRLGIITNGEKGISLEKMEALDLQSHVEHTVISDEVGVAKPDSRIFEYACQIFGLAPGEVVYVGDRLQTDAIGAHKAGLNGIWLNRSGQLEATGLDSLPVSCVESLRQLPSLCLAGGQLENK